VGAFADLFNQLDADARIKGTQFERICKWFLTNDPIYKHELHRVWLWDEWPGRWGIDAGIDLVAELDVTAAIDKCFFDELMWSSSTDA
jgi:predicted helicase